VNWITVDCFPGQNGGQGYNPGNNGGQGYNPGNNGGQGYNPGNNGGQGFNPGSNGGQGYNPGNNGGSIQFPGYNPGGRLQGFRTPIIFAEEESEEETFAAVGALGGAKGGPLLEVEVAGSQGVTTLPAPLGRFPGRRPYRPGQDKGPLLRQPYVPGQDKGPLLRQPYVPGQDKGPLLRQPYVPGQDKGPLLRRPPAPEVYIQEPGAPGGPWDQRPLPTHLLLRPWGAQPQVEVQVEGGEGVHTLPAGLGLTQAPQLRPAPAQPSPALQVGPAQTLPSPIVWAGQPYTPGADKSPNLRAPTLALLIRPSTNLSPSIQAGLAQTLPSPIQFAEEPQSQPSPLQLARQPQARARAEVYSQPQPQPQPQPYPGLTFPYFRQSLAPPAPATIIYIF